MSIARLKPLVVVNGAFDAIFKVNFAVPLELSTFNAFVSSDKVNWFSLLTVNADLASNDNEILLLLSTLIGAMPSNFNVAPPPPPEPLNGTKQVSNSTEDGCPVKSLVTLLLPSKSA